jgi:DNA-binding CsgD family transcriptional regulator
MNAIQKAIEADLRCVHGRPHTWVRRLAGPVTGASSSPQPLLVSYVPLTRSKEHAIGGVIWLRGATGRTFCETDRLTLHLLHSSLTRLWVPIGRSSQTNGTGTVDIRSSPRVLDLTVRQRQALRCLLDGLSEQAAARVMGVTRNTFHVHVKAIYREVGVRSRAELMATLLKP